MSLESSTTILSPIENEIPTYRAVSSLAVFSLLLGIGAVFTFANTRMAVLGVGAIVAGLISLRKIKHYPDILTGAKLARIGITLGLIFILSATTFDYVRRYKVKTSAARFAQGYTDVLKDKNLAKAAWYRLTPTNRSAAGPDEALNQFTEGGDPMSADMYLGPIKSIHSLLEKGGDIHFVELEKYGYQGITPYALALFEVHSKDDQGKETEDYGMLEVRSAETGAFDWYVHEIVFPYKPSTYAVAPKPVDDGHGHSH